MSPVVQYWLAVVVAAAVGALACLAARRFPGAIALGIGRGISLVLAGVGAAFIAGPAVDGTWAVGGSLPLSLCDVALLVAAATCWWPRWRLGVELTYFWGLAGTLQAVVTPDLSAPFPQLEFFMFVAGHVGIVVAACYFVLGLHLAPRRGVVGRVFITTAAYTALVGIVDAGTGANYMFLRRPPSHASLLSALGPWPWYLAGAAVVALALFVLLDLPFRLVQHRRPDADHATGSSAPRSSRGRSPVAPARTPRRPSTIT